MGEVYQARDTRLERRVAIKILPEVFAQDAERVARFGDQAQIVVQSLKSGERQVLIDGGSDARYVPTGHIVYALGADLLAIPFDEKESQTHRRPGSDPGESHAVCAAKHRRCILQFLEMS